MTHALIDEILIVEDSPTQAQATSALLEVAGFDVDIVWSGEDALERIQERKPKVLLADILMPGMDGYELCHSIKSRRETWDIRIALLTQLCDASSILKGLANGADMLLSKPRSLSDLVRRLDDVRLPSGKAGDDAERRSVLLVEDSATQAAQFRHLLEEEGCEVEWRRDGAAALDLLREYRPSVVLSDVMMPKMDGVQLCWSIKDDPELQTIPVVLLTSLADPTDIVREMEAGADYYLSKPYDDDDFVQRIAKLSSDRREGFASSSESTSEMALDTLTRDRLLGLLVTTYEKSVDDNKTLRRTRKRLEQLTVELEERVGQRTRELRKSESRLREAQRIAHLGNLQWEPSSGELWWSDEVFLILGAAPGELESSREELISRIHPDDRELVAAALDSVGEEGATRELQIRVVRPGGMERVLFVKTEVELGGEEDEVRLMATLLDITERVTAETDLRIEERRSEEVLREAQKMEAVGTLTGGMAHEFNNLLAVVLGNAQLAQRQLPADSAVREELSSIGAAAEQAAALITKLLTFSQKQMRRPEVVDLCARIGALETIAVPLAGERTKVRFVLSEEPCRTTIDGTQLEQAVLNLVLNAGEAMPDGGELTIEVRPTRFEGSDHPSECEDYVLVSVEDTGRGIAPDMLDRIFEPFFTTTGSRSRSGLGLAVVYGIVRGADGHVRVSSELGKGTRFEIYLPRDVA